MLAPDLGGDGGNDPSVGFGLGSDCESIAPHIEGRLLGQVGCESAVDLREGWRHPIGEHPQADIQQDDPMRYGLSTRIEPASDHDGTDRVSIGCRSGVDRLLGPAVAPWCSSEVTTLAGATGLELVEGRADDLAVGLPDAWFQPALEAFCRGRDDGLLGKKIIPGQRFAKRPAARRV